MFRESDRGGVCPACYMIKHFIELDTQLPDPAALPLFPNLVGEIGAKEKVVETTDDVAQEPHGGHQDAPK